MSLEDRIKRLEEELGIIPSDSQEEGQFNRLLQEFWEQGDPQQVRELQDLIFEHMKLKADIEISLDNGLTVEDKKEKLQELEQELQCLHDRYFNKWLGQVE